MTLTPLSQFRHFDASSGPSSRRNQNVTEKIGASLSPNRNIVSQVGTAALYLSPKNEVTPKITGERLQYRSPSRASDTPKFSTDQMQALENAKACVQEAESYRKNGQVSKSLESLINRVRILKDSLPNSLFLATAYTDLGIEREKNGDLNKALECFERAKPIINILQTDPTELFKFYGKLALLNESSYKIPQALECYEKSMNILGSSPIYAKEIAGVRDKAANLYEAQGDQSGKALRHRLDNLPFYEEIYASTLKLANYYDLIGAMTGNPTVQDDFFKKSIKIEKSLRAESPEVQAHCQRICKMYEDKSKLEAAFIQLSKDVDHDSVPCLLSHSYLSLAGVRNSLVKMIENINKFEKTLRRKVELDPQNLCVAIFSECVADQYTAQENERRAKEFFGIALAARKIALGEKDTTVDALSQKILSLQSRLVSMSQARMGSVYRAKSIAPQPDDVAILIRDIGKYSSGLILKNEEKEKARDKLKGLLEAYKESQEESKRDEIAQYVHKELKMVENPIFAGAHSGNLSALFYRVGEFFRV